MEQSLSNGDGLILSDNSIIDADEWFRGVKEFRDVKELENEISLIDRWSSLRKERASLTTGLTRGLARKRSAEPLTVATRSYLISFAWLTFYVTVSISTGALSLYLFAYKEYLLLPASVLVFVSFTILALIRLAIHIKEHDGLANVSALKKAA